MKVRILLALLFCGLLGTFSASAQCVTLADMASVAAEPKALAKPDQLGQLPPGEWVLRGSAPRSKEILWTSSSASEGAVPPAAFLLRPLQESFDVVLKTTDPACVREIRSELKSQKLTAVPVTCPSCEAMRYEGPRYQTTIYSKMKGDYPFVVVLHPVPVVPAVTKQAGTSSAQ
jgi:hypothetical protein